MNLTLIFQIADRDYGLEIEAVQEIIEDPERYPVPRSGPCLCGAINVHGEVLPVIDLPALMGEPPAKHDARVVVLSPEYRHAALLVNKVERIVFLDFAQKRVDAEAGSDPFCREVVGRAEGTPVRLLELKMVYSQLEQLFNDNGGTLCP